MRHHHDLNNDPKATPQPKPTSRADEVLFYFFFIPIVVLLSLGAMFGIGHYLVLAGH